MSVRSVVVSRLETSTAARTACILVGSLALFEPECHSPAQMRLANAFCRYLENGAGVPLQEAGSVRRSPVIRPTTSSWLVDGPARAGDPAMAQDHDPVGDVKGVQDIVRDTMIATPFYLICSIRRPRRVCCTPSAANGRRAGPAARPSARSGRARLPAAGRERDARPWSARGDVGAEIGERPLGLGLHRRLAQETEAGHPAVKLAPHEENRDNVDVRGRARDPDRPSHAERLRVRRAIAVTVTVEVHTAAARFKRAGEDLISVDCGAVVAEQRHHLAGPHSKLTSSSATTGPKCLESPGGGVTVPPRWWMRRSLRSFRTAAGHGACEMLETGSSRRRDLGIMESPIAASGV